MPSSFAKLTTQVSLCSPRERVTEVWEREREAWGIPPMEALPHRGEVKCLPNPQPGLVCLCISSAVILKKKPSPFQPRSLCKQLEVTKEEVVTQWTTHSCGPSPGRSLLTCLECQDRAWEKREGKGASRWPRKPIWWQHLLSSRKQSVQTSKGFLLTWLLCFYIYCLPFGFMVILTP